MASGLEAAAKDFSTLRSPLFEFVQNCCCGAGATAAGPELPHPKQTCKVADAASRLYLDFRRAACPHQFQIVFGRAFVTILAVGTFDETITGRGLHPVRAGALGNRAELALEIIPAQAGAAAGQVIVFEDNFHFSVLA